MELWGGVGGKVHQSLVGNVDNAGLALDREGLRPGECVRRRYLQAGSRGGCEQGPLIW